MHRYPGGWVSWIFQVGLLLTMLQVEGAPAFLILHGEKIAWQMSQPVCTQPYCIYFPIIYLNFDPSQATGVDLAVQMTAIPSDNTILYKITIRNSGPQTSTGVTVSVDLPEHTSFDPGNSDPGWQATGDGKVIQFLVGNLGLGAIRTLQLAVIVGGDLPAGQSLLQSRARIKDDGVHGPELNPYDNSISLDVPIDIAPSIRIFPPELVNLAMVIGQNTVKTQMTVFSNTRYAVAVFDSGPTGWHMTEWDGSNYLDRRLEDPLVIANPAQSIAVSEGTSAVLATGEGSGPEGQTIDLVFSQILHYTDPKPPPGVSYHMVIVYLAYINP
ncbi:MAG TPA: hypothetical protein VMT46_19090 [Anaerolineaceae bacterium]|nr:hypothetical protein [Anaerolineaceae bacterium]